MLVIFLTKMQTKRYHILIDIKGTNNDVLNNEEGLANFLKTLPGVIGMHVLKGPEIAVGIPENPGLSGFVIIDYSHISIHTFTKYQEALVDIFSCKPYEQNDASKAVLDYFQVNEDQAQVQEVSWG